MPLNAAKKVNLNIRSLVSGGIFTKARDAMIPYGIISGYALCSDFLV